MIAEDGADVVFAGEFENAGAVRAPVDEISDGKYPVRCLRFQQLQHPAQFPRAAMDIAKDEGPSSARRKIPNAQLFHGSVRQLR